MSRHDQRARTRGCGSTRIASDEITITTVHVSATDCTIAIQPRLPSTTRVDSMATTNRVLAAARTTGGRVHSRRSTETLVFPRNIEAAVTRPHSSVSSATPCNACAGGGWW